MGQILLIFLFLIPGFLFSQNKTISAVFIEDNSIHVDGFAEELWSGVPVASGFTQVQTKPGEKASFPSKVKIAYDHTGLFVFARMHDPKPDSILREIGQRDQENTNSDEFTVILDTYNDKINGYVFTVTASGVQIDKRISANGEDVSWNAVWYSKVLHDSLGWTVELKIPFSAIRFYSGESMVWGVNFGRGIRRYREISYWNKVDPKVDGLINQSGTLTGLRNIKPPVRLSLTPYVASYLYHESEGGLSTSQSAGADLKYGINESFTLDLTLIPDFGQVQSDNLVLNLSPFEVRYNEFRPFFTEGTELFNKGGFFYSRRVGGTPIFFQNEYDGVSREELIENPSSAQLINAFKLSGRTRKGLGIGVFNAVTAPGYAVFDTSGIRQEILTSPLTNYSVIVADQSLKNNSYISFVNTNVTRSNKVQDANVSGGLFRLVNKSNTLAVKGKAALSALYGFDAPEYEETSSVTGHEAELEFAKISGSFTTGIGYLQKSDHYEINDLGYLALNNIKEIYGSMGYSKYSPFWKVNNWHNKLSYSYSRLYSPDLFYKFFVQFTGNTTFTKQFLSVGYTISTEPVPVHDHYEARVPGFAYIVPENYTISSWISSDYRKKLALDINGSFRRFNEPGRKTWKVSVSPRIRMSNRILVILGEEANFASNDAGFVTLSGKVPVIGTRDVVTFTQSLNGRFVFSPLMNINLRLRHYWSQAVYEDYFALVPNDVRLQTGEEKVSFNPGEDYDINFNVVNLDLVYSWTFSPGSELNFTWKFYQLDNQSEIYTNYIDLLGYLHGRPFYNTLSLKVLYYLDYQEVKNTFKKGKGQDLRR